MLFKIAFLYCIMAGCAPHTQQQSQQQPATLYQHWIHNFEEDNAEKKYIVYRPAGFAFRPARGRDGFEIKENGVFIEHLIARGDGDMPVTRKWSIKADELTVIGENNSSRFRIISVTKDKLIITRLPQK